MFNYCVFSGRVITIPTLRYFGKDKPVTEFTLQILMGNHRCGTIKVVNFGRLAMEAAKYLSMGDRVAVAGFIFGAKHQQDDGAYRYELRLVATDVAPLREDPEIEPEPSGGDLLY
jgi:single-stranded DNA-binding protein